MENNKYDILLIDPPWPYYGDPNKMGAAGKHYQLMTEDDIFNLNPKRFMADKAIAFVWATSPKLNLAIKSIDAWGLHYRGVAFVWAKSRKDGGLIHGQGVPPTVTKPTTEYLLSAATVKRGRPLPILSAAIPQIVIHPRLAHSEKPQVFHKLIEELYGDRPRLELFARREVEGWDCTGLELDGVMV